MLSADKKSAMAPLNIVAIIQARMRSTRLPGKVLADISGSPMLLRVVNRVRAAKTLGQVVIATTIERADDSIAEFCREHRLNCFRGSENDVLDRYYQTAREYRADIIVRITSDCPLIDPEIIDRTVQAFLDERADYASNSLAWGFPRGLDTEVMTFLALEAAWLEAAEDYQRAHVTAFLYENPKQFKILPVTAGKDYSTLRWTVDTPEDLEFVRAVYSRFENGTFLFRDILELLDREPLLSDINRLIMQKALREG
jgi:spore coat polysaccharide biosynthesis protein SpsF